MVCVGFVWLFGFCGWLHHDHQKVQDSNLNHALATIDPQNQRFEPTTMHYYTTIGQKKSKIRTHDHALHHH
jgi:hypothetical protein